MNRFLVSLLAASAFCLPAIAAEELGVSRSHLHRVLVGERKSPPLVARWNSWLKRHPEFANIQPKQPA